MYAFVNLFSMCYKVTFIEYFSFYYIYETIKTVTKDTDIKDSL